MKERVLRIIIISLATLLCSSCSFKDSSIDEYNRLSKELETAKEEYNNKYAYYESLIAKNEEDSYKYFAREDVYNSKTTIPASNDLVGIWDSEEEVLILFNDNTGVRISGSGWANRSTYVHNLEYDYQNSIIYYAISSEIFTDDSDHSDETRKYYEEKSEYCQFKIEDNHLYCDFKIYERIGGEQ